MTRVQGLYTYEEMFEEIVLACPPSSRYPPHLAPLRASEAWLPGRLVPGAIQPGFGVISAASWVKGGIPKECD